MTSKPTLFLFVVILVSALGVSGCRYATHRGRVGLERRPLDDLGHPGVPRIEFGKSSPEELAGLLRPTVMTVWFQPHKTVMGDMAGGYPLRVQIQPDGFADERIPFSYGSLQAPKTSVFSLKPKKTTAKSPVRQNPEKLKQPDATGEVTPSGANLKAITADYLRKVFKEGSTIDRKPGKREQQDSNLTLPYRETEPKLRTLDDLQQLFN